jgi:DNA (cytosine-5)-methyltransferase 1
MKIVELFAGIGGFRLAGDRLGFPTIWANDCCSSACKVYRDRFGDSLLHEGDVTKLVGEIPNHDILTAGFPCQPFSSAGKKQGIKDPRGTLFSVVVDVLGKHQPEVFVLENVKRLLAMENGVHFATILASLAALDYWIEWRLLNATDFGLAQNRERVFIVGVRRPKKDKNLGMIRLASISDLTTRSVKTSPIHSQGQWPLIASHGKRFPNWGLAVSGRFCGADLSGFSQRRPHGLLRSVLQESVPSAFDFTASTVERLKASKFVQRFVGGVEILSNQGGGARMGYTVFGIDGVAPTLTSSASRHYERYKVGRTYRRLTNVEYARLQGFPDEHCAVASIYDQYSLFGNAVPPPMATWVLKRATMPGVAIDRIPHKKQQKRLFADA